MEPKATHPGQRRQELALLALFLAVIGGVFFFDLIYALAAPPKPKSIQDVLRGKWMRRLDSFFVGEYSCMFQGWRTVVTEGLYTLTGEVQPGVFMGMDGWLSIQAEMVDRTLSAKKKDQLYTESVASLARIRDYMTAHGVEVFMLVPPNRLRIYPEYFFKDCRVPSYMRTSYKDLIHKLQVAHFETIDLEEVFREEKRKDSMQGILYHTADHHWTSRGCLAACQQVTDRIRILHPEWCNTALGSIHLNEPFKTTTETTLSKNLGFSNRKLIQFLARPVMYFTVSYQRPFTAVEKDETPFLLIGDSFAHSFPGIMVEYLEYDLQAPVQGAYVHDGMPFWFKSDRFVKKKPSYLIWEIWEANFTAGSVVGIDDAMLHPKEPMKMN